MPWVRFDDSSPDNPKIDALTDGAFRLWFNAICYSNRNLTDGHVPAARVPRLTPHYKPAHLTELLNAGAFHKDTEGGITIHGYLDYQPSAQQITEQRAYERERKARRRQTGTSHTDRDTTNGQYMSRRDNHPDTTPDRRPESEQESPATQPNPTQPNINKSSSSEPLVATSHEEEEEDQALQEARRRLTNRVGPPITNPNAWIATTAQRLRNEGFQPHNSHPTPQLPDCDTCDNLRLTETPDGYTQCPDCKG